MPERTIRVGIVGAGWMGQVHARSWTANAPRGSIVAVTDASSARSQALADEHTAGQARVYTDLAALLGDRAVDAVDICLPHHLHADAIVRAVRAGKHVLCEKPLCLTLEEAREIGRVLAETGVTLVCAHNNLFALPLIEARRLIQEGVLGKLYHVQSNEIGRNTFIRTGRPPVTLAEGENTFAWRRDRERMGGAELLDTGWHGIYRLLALADAATPGGDRPTEVTAMLANYHLPEVSGEDTATLLVQFASGLQGVMLTSWAFGGEPGAWQFRAAGEHGVLAGSVTKLVHAAHGWPAGAERVWPTTHSETYVREVTHFLDVLLDAAESQAGWQHGARTLQVVRAAQISAEQRRVIALPVDPTEL